MFEGLDNKAEECVKFGEFYVNVVSCRFQSPVLIDMYIILS